MFKRRKEKRVEIYYRCTEKIVFHSRYNFLDYFYIYCSIVEKPRAVFLSNPFKVGYYLIYWRTEIENPTLLLFFSFFCCSILKQLPISIALQLLTRLLMLKLVQTKT